MSSWDPDLYLRFERERGQPLQDLLEALPDDLKPRRILDAGCGPGNSTAAIARRFPDGDIKGIDASPDMIERARRDHPHITFCLEDLRDHTPDRPYDLVVCNAVLHWLADPEVVLSRIVGWIAPGGCLAAQVPANFDSPGHLAIRDVLSGPAWRERFQAHTNEDHLLPAARYQEVLEQAGFQARVWDHEYIHDMADLDELVAWYAGTTLRPFLAEADDAAGSRLLTDVAQALANAYGAQAPIQFLFRRRFMVARRLD